METSDIHAFKEQEDQTV